MNQLLISLLLLLTITISSVCSTDFVKDDELTLERLDIYEDKIIQKIEELREELRKGIPEHNIPPMDPLILDARHFQINAGEFNINITLSGEVDGLLGFNITNIELQALSFKLKYDFIFPAINVNVTNYNLNAAIRSVPVVGDGTLGIDVEGLRFHGEAKLGVKEVDKTHLAISLDSIQIMVDLANFVFDLTGFQHDEVRSKGISDFLSNYWSNFIYGMSGDICGAIERLVTQLTAGKSIIIDL